MSARFAYTTGDADESGRRTRKTLAWALLRLFLGSLQMSLAALALGALLIKGLNTVTLYLAISATAATLLSRALFRGRRKMDKGEPKEPQHNSWREPTRKSG